MTESMIPLRKKKCGRRDYWEDWATNIAKIAQTHITRILAIVSNPENTKEVEAFTAFTNELRNDLNDSITDDEVIEMLAQHLITKPVFDALFKDYSFANHNPVSLAMQRVLEALYNHNITIKDIPLEAYSYIVNGKPALEWVMERQCVKVDKDSGIINNANRYAIETVGDPVYPLTLFQRVITVSLETMKIVNSLPPLVVAFG